MKRVAITGIGMALDGACCSDAWSLLEHASRRRHPNVLTAAAIDSSWIPAKDRKVLGQSDPCALTAAALAMADAGLGEADKVPGIGCVVFNTGKGTRSQELTQVRLQYPTPDYKPDMVAVAAALENGEASDNPLTLLHNLDNSVLWWLCKRYKIREVNLQITQAVHAAETALLEAIDAIRFDGCDLCLVGGQQTVTESAVALAARQGRFVSEDDPAVGGAAVFFVLQARAPELRSYGELTIKPSEAQQRAVSTGSANWGCPAIESLLPIIRAVLGDGRAAEESVVAHCSNGALNIEFCSNV